MVLVHERLDPNRDARDTLDSRRHGRGHKREEAGRGYHPHHGGSYDNSENRSSSPELPWP